MVNSWSPMTTKRKDITGNGALEQSMATRHIKK